MNNYERIASAIEYIAANVENQPGLDELATHVNLSPYHFQRLFSNWAGISPKRFLQSQTLEHAKLLLRNSNSVLQTTHDLGLSSTARLHDHFITIQGITPGEYKTRGKNLIFYWGVCPTPFGDAWVAMTDRGIYSLSFLDGEDTDEQLDSIRWEWPLATFSKNPGLVEDMLRNVFNIKEEIKKPISLFVKGTNFQINVWKALLKIPLGNLMSYGQIAQSIGKPTASRAVGNAIADNPIAFLIPCHRVIQANGNTGGYRWNTTRKKAIITWESAQL